MTSLSSFGQEVTLSRVVPHARLKSTREESFHFAFEICGSTGRMYLMDILSERFLVSLCLNKLLMSLPFFQDHNENIQTHTHLAQTYKQSNIRNDPQ